MKRTMKINPIIFLCLILLPAGMMAQITSVSISGIIKEKVSGEALSFVNVVLTKPVDSSLVAGTISNENGLFTITEVKPGEYFIALSSIGYSKYIIPLFVDSNSAFIDIALYQTPEAWHSGGRFYIPKKKDSNNHAIQPIRNKFCT